MQVHTERWPARAELEPVASCLLEECSERLAGIISVKSDAWVWDIVYDAGL